MRSGTLLPLAAVLACSVAAYAQPDTAPASEHHFTAQWITADEAPGHDPAVLRLRRELTLTAAPAHFRVHVSADNHFLLMVNGRRIGEGPAIGDVQHWRYETYDLAPALHAGRNLLAATVWNLGDQAPIRQLSSHLGFVLDPDTPEEAAAATGTSWLAARDPGFTFLPKPAELGDNYYVGSPGERLDAGAMLWNWSDGDAWPKASEAHPAEISGAGPAPGWGPAVSLGEAVPRGVHSESNSWLLVPDRLPQMEYAQTSAGHLVRATGMTPPKFPSAPVQIPPNTHVTLLLDRETLTTAYPTVTVSGGKGARVTLRYAEALVDDQGNKGNRNQIEGKHLVGVADELLPDGAERRAFTPLDWRTWRYLEIDIATAGQPLQLDAVTVAFTAYPFEQRARFASDDPALAEIWKVGWRTARLCAHDAYMDTPYWERLQYVGDTRIQALVSYTNAGDDRLARQAIEAFHSSLLPEGITQSRYPSRHLQVIQNFSLLFIGIVHDYWFYRDDPEFVRAQLPALRSVLSYFRARLTPDGLPALKDWWPFVDWAVGFAGGDSPASAEGVSAAGSLFYLEALRNAAELERGLGDRALAEEDAAEAAGLQKTILARFWSPGELLVADTPALDHYSQQANALAVWLDVVPQKQQAEVMTRIYSATDPGFHAGRPLPQAISIASSYFRFYLTRALVHAGLGDRYVETLAPWRTMLANGLTTWAEQPEPTRSDSHAWAAHPNIDLLTTVAGITPGAPGFASVDVAPRLGSLHQLAVAYSSPHGEIAAEYSVSQTGVSARVSLPPSLTGTLHWSGRQYPLHPGVNALKLPVESASARPSAFAASK